MPCYFSMHNSISLVSLYRICTDIIKSVHSKPLGARQLKKLCFFSRAEETFRYILLKVQLCYIFTLEYTGKTDSLKTGKRKLLFLPTIYVWFYAHVPHLMAGSNGTATGIWLR